MNKIKNLLKASPIAVVVASLVIVGVASAVLENHLSNSVKADATLTSPIKMSVNKEANGAPTGNLSITIDTTGGSDFTFTTVAKNNANNEIEGYPVIVAVAPEGKNFIGGEITKVMFGDKNYGPWPGLIGQEMLDITDKLYIVDSGGNLVKLSTWTGDSQRLVLFFDNDGNGVAQSYPLAAGEVNWNVLTITPHQAIAEGTYEIYAQYANDLAEYATYQYGL